MKTTSANLADLRALLTDGRLGAWSDGQLLARFVNESGTASERAFAVLVERHGPRVHRVCRAVVGDPHSADDAFQATFLILARKASALKVGDSLGPWLHGVALRVSLAARDARLRRSRHETAAAARGEPLHEPRLGDPELAAILHSEIGRLPAAYREAVYLCDVEGYDAQAAAGRLRCAVGTIKSRLSRGRRRLRARLIRRGIVPATIAAAFADQARAMPGPSMVEATARMAAAFGSCRPIAGTVPAAVAVLFEQGMTEMFQWKLRALVASTLVSTLTAAVTIAGQDRPLPNASPTSTGPAEGGQAIAQARGPESSESRASSTAPLAASRTDIDAELKAVLQQLARKNVNLLNVSINKLIEERQAINLAGHEANAGKPSQLVTTKYNAVVTTKTPDGQMHTTQVEFETSEIQPIAAPGEALGRIAPSPVPIPEKYTKPRPSDSERIDAIERKLDALMKALERSMPGAQPEPAPTPRVVH